MSVTTDGGATWTSAGRLYAAGADADHRPGGVCGYPDIVSLGDDTLGAVLHVSERRWHPAAMAAPAGRLVSSPTVRVDARGSRTSSPGSSIVGVCPRPMRGRPREAS